MPTLFFRDGWWICQSNDWRTGLVTGIGETEAIARERWAELMKRLK